MLEKNLNRFYSLGYTFFLNEKDRKEVEHHLKKNTYNVFKPYNDPEKTIIYTRLPKVYLYEIKTKAKLTHQMILGSIFSLGIEDYTFGDIIITDKYYVYILDIINNYFISAFNYVGKNKIELEEKEINYLKDYERKYEEYEIITSSERIDLILSKIIHTNRENTIKKIKDKEIYLNYELLTKYSNKFKEGDIFSIRKLGKFKYIGVVNKTKKNLVVKYLKYK